MLDALGIEKGRSSHRWNHTHTHHPPPRRIKAEFDELQHRSTDELPLAFKEKRGKGSLGKGFLKVRTPKKGFSRAEASPDSGGTLHVLVS